MEYVGEVVESSTRGFIAVTPRVGESPYFGSFVKTNAGIVTYGIVCEVKTGSKEPGRKATALGMSLEELRREQPHIFEILQTEFHVLTIAYWGDGRIRFSQSPAPPPIHSFVYPCTMEETASLVEEDFFLRTIISSPNASVDDLIVSSLLYAQEARSHEPHYIVRMGKSLARIFKDDYERLSSLLRRVV